MKDHDTTGGLREGDSARGPMRDHDTARGGDAIGALNAQSHAIGALNAQRLKLCQRQTPMHGEAIHLATA